MKLKEEVDKDKAKNNVSYCDKRAKDTGLSSLDMQALYRDGYQCVISGDRDHSDLVPPDCFVDDSESPSATYVYTECAHIVLQC